MMVVIIATLRVLSYANDGEKSDDNYCRLPWLRGTASRSTWAVFQTPAWANIAATIFLAIMTLVPLHYTHPARVAFPDSEYHGVAAWTALLLYPVQPLRWTLDPVLGWRLVPHRRLHPYGDRRGQVVAASRTGYERPRTAPGDAVMRAR